MESVSFPPLSPCLVAEVEEGFVAEDEDEEEEGEGLVSEVDGAVVLIPLLPVDASEEVLERELTQRLPVLAESPSSSSSSRVGGGQVGIGGGQDGNGGGISSSCTLTVLVGSLVGGLAVTWSPWHEGSGGTLLLATVGTVVGTD